MKLFLRALWTAVCLAGLESLIGFAISLISYKIELRWFTQDLPDPNIWMVLLQAYRGTFYVRCGLGFAIFTALCFKQMATYKNKWPLVIVCFVNFGAFLFMLLLFSKVFAIKEWLLKMMYPFHTNILKFVVGVSLISPVIIAKCRIPGTIFPRLQGKDAKVINDSAIQKNVV